MRFNCLNQLFVVAHADHTITMFFFFLNSFDTKTAHFALPVCSTIKAVVFFSPKLLSQLNLLILIMLLLEIRGEKV